MIRVLLVDEQAAVRRGLRLRLALEPDVAVVGEAGDVGQALVLARTLLPDVVVMDLEMSDLEGMEAIRRLGKMGPCCAVVILTLRGDAETRTRAKEAGAQAFLEKQGGAEVLLQVIHQIAQDSPPTLEDAGGGSEERRQPEARGTWLQSLGPERVPRDQDLEQPSPGQIARAGDLKGVPVPMQQETLGLALHASARRRLSVG